MTDDRLNATLFALSDSTRRGILARLSTGEATVGELAEPYEMSLAAVSKHLKVLEGAGLISRGREAQWRPCRLEAAPLKDVASWIEEYRRVWAPHLDALERYLDHMAPSTPTKKKTKRTRRGPDRETDSRSRDHDCS